MNKNISLLVPFIEGTLLFRLGSYEADPQHREDRHYQFTKVLAIDQTWRRFRMKNRVSLDKVLAKTFPAAVELPMPEIKNDDDLRLLINSFIDDGETYMVDFGRGEPFGRYLCTHPCSRMDENGEVINKDGIPERLIDCMTGIPYPTPPEGMNRYTVSMNFSGGGSYYDAHKMFMAVTAKEAAQQVIDDLPNQKKEMGDFAEMFMGGEIGLVMVTNKDTEETEVFEGKTLTQSKEASFLGQMLNRLGASEDQDEVEDILLEAQSIFPEPSISMHGTQRQPASALKKGQ